MSFSGWSFKDATQLSLSLTYLVMTVFLVLLGILKNLIEPVFYFIQTILSESLDEEYKHIVCMLLMLKVVVCNDNQNWNAWQQKIEKIELESTGM